MVALTAEAAAATPAVRDTDLDHYYCCDPDIGLCGTDLTGVPEISFMARPCAVCMDLVDMDAGCPVCSPV